MFQLRAASSDVPSAPPRRARTTPGTSGLVRVLRCAMPLLLLLVLVGCGADDDDEEAASDIVEGIPTVATPEALDELPQGIGEATLEIDDGEFDVEDLYLQQGEPTELDVVNNDDEDYRFRVGEGLVEATDIPAGETTTISFTTPNAGTQEGQLLAADEDTVVDEVSIVVQEAGGVEE